MTDDIKIGAEIEIGYPFILEEVDMFDADGPYRAKSWRPGTRGEIVAPGDNVEMVADGIGSQIMYVVDIHKPGKYPARVFFTRRWRDPKGREFGKTKLCIMTLGAFRTRARGFRHEYSMAQPALLHEDRDGAAHD